MEHEEMDMAQKIRQQLGLPPLAKSSAPIGFEDIRKEKAPDFRRWAISAMSGTSVDWFHTEWERHVARQMQEIHMGTTPPVSRAADHLPLHRGGFGREGVRGIVDQMELIRKMEVERMLYGSTYLRVVESEHITKEVQARHHRKKRINKKWRKRYGTKRVPDLNTMVLYQEPSGERVLLAHPKRVERIRTQIDMVESNNPLWTGRARFDITL